MAAPVVATAQLPAARSIAPAQSAPATPPVDSGDVLKPGDLIRLRIWREPDLSGDFDVDKAGMAVLPKLGPTQVTAQALDALRVKLVSAYAVYLNHPSIEVTFLHRIQVTGAVRTPGLFPVDPTMTLSDALALAGGVTPDGNQKEVVLIRNGVRQRYALTRNTPFSEAHIRSGDQIYVPERSWISRNPGFLAALITAGVSVLVAFHH